MWRETLQVLMAPDHLEYRILPPLGLSPSGIGSVDCRTAATTETPWQPACEALTTLVDDTIRRPLRIEIQLSDRFVRYQVLAWQPGLATRAEWRAYAEHGFAAIYGEAARQWQLRIELVPPGNPSLACAIDGTLVSTLRTLAADRGSRLVGLRPRFVSLFSRRNIQPRGHDQVWFGVAEERHLCLGAQLDKQWRALRNEPAPDGWHAALPGAIRRIRCELDAPAGNGILYLCGGLGAASMPASLEGLTVRAAETSFLRGRAAAVPVLETE